MTKTEMLREELEMAIDAYAEARAIEETFRVEQGKYGAMAASATRTRREDVMRKIDEMTREVAA